MWIICKIKGWWRTLWYIPDYPICGCDYVQQKDGSLKCEICGKEPLTQEVSDE